MSISVYPPCQFFTINEHIYWYRSIYYANSNGSKEIDKKEETFLRIYVVDYILTQGLAICF